MHQASVRRHIKRQRGITAFHAPRNEPSWPFAKHAGDVKKDDFHHKVSPLKSEARSRDYLSKPAKKGE
jgi:hypothetical protein